MFRDSESAIFASKLSARSLADDLPNTVWRVTEPRAVAMGSPVGPLAGQK